MVGGSGITKEEERGELGVSRAPGETEAKRPRVDGSVRDDALQHPCSDSHQRLKPLMYVFFSLFHSSEEAAGGLCGSRVQPGRETGGLSALKLCPLHRHVPNRRLLTL